MSEIFPWIRRQFLFDFPVEQYPNICIRLRGTPARLEDLVRGLAPDRLRHKPIGKLSIQENAGHLENLELLWSTRLDEFLAGKETLTAADMSNAATQQAGHNDRRIDEILYGFRKHRERSATSLDLLSPIDFSRTALHPRLQRPIRLVDHLFFIAEHDDHHLARIWELRGARP